MLTIVYTACIMSTNSNERLQPTLDVSGLQRMLLTPSWARLLGSFLGYNNPERREATGKRFIGPSTQPTFTPCTYSTERGVIFNGYRAEVCTNREYGISMGEYVRPVSLGYAQLARINKSPDELFIIDAISRFSIPSRLTITRPIKGDLVAVSYNSEDIQRTYFVDLVTENLKAVVVGKYGTQEQLSDSPEDHYDVLGEISRICEDVFSFERLPLDNQQV